MWYSQKWQIYKLTSGQTDHRTPEEIDRQTPINGPDTQIWLVDWQADRQRTENTWLTLPTSGALMPQRTESSGERERETIFISHLESANRKHNSVPSSLAAAATATKTKAVTQSDASGPSTRNQSRDNHAGRERRGGDGWKIKNTYSCLHHPGRLCWRNRRRRSRRADGETEDREGLVPDHFCECVRCPHRVSLTASPPDAPGGPGPCDYYTYILQL